MLKQWILFGAAVLVFPGVAAELKEVPSDSVQALILRMDALLVTDERQQGELLFQSFAADPLHEVRSAELLSRILLREVNEKLPQRVDDFCAKYPDSLPGALLRYLCQSRLGKTQAEGALLIDALKRTAASLPDAPEEEQKLWLSLYGAYLETELSSGNYESAMIEAQQLCRKLEGRLQQSALSDLVRFLHRAAFRKLYAVPGGKKWLTLPSSPLKDGFDAALTALRRSEDELSPAELETRFQLYMALDHPAALEYARKNALHGTLGVKKMYLTAAVQFAGPGEFEAALRALPEPIMQQEANRFLFAMRRRDYAAAERVIARQPEDRFRDLLQMTCWGQKKEFAKLREKVLKLIDSGVFSPQLLTSLLLVAEQQKDAALLRRAYALAGSAPEPNSANSLGYVSAVLGTEYEKAEKMLLLALEMEPDNCAYQDSYAWLLYRQRKFSEAREWIRRALRNAVPGTGIGVILEHAGEVELALGNKKDAIRFWKEALTCESEDPELDAPALRKKLEKLEAR